MNLVNATKINDLEKQEENFRSSIIVDPEKSEKRYTELVKVFLSCTPKQDREKLFLDFKHYTELVWKRLNSFSNEVVLDVVARQIPVALLLDFDVLTDLLWYIAAQVSSHDEEKRKQFYILLKKNFLESSAIVGEFQGRDVTVKMLVDEIKNSSFLKKESKIPEEFIKKLENIFFPTNNELIHEYFLVDQNVVVNRFIKLVQFFLSTKDENINLIINKLLHPKIGNSVTVEKSKQIKKFEPKKEQSALPKPPEVKKTAQSFAQIKQNITRATAMTPAGERPVKIMAELDALAAEMKDDMIRELYYFNQQTGKFEWNDVLLKQ